MNEFFILIMKNLNILHSKHIIQNNEEYNNQLENITSYFSNLRNLFSLDIKEIIVFKNRISNFKKYEKEINNNKNLFINQNKDPKVKLILYNNEQHIIKNKTFYILFKESALLNILINVNNINNSNNKITLPNITKEDIIFIEEIINNNEKFKKSIYPDHLMVRLLFSINFLKINKLEKIVFTKIIHDYSIERIKDIFNGLLNSDHLL